MSRSQGTSSRDSLIRRTLVATAGSRGLSLIGTLALTPVLTRELSRDQYGVLVTLTTASTVVGLADLGVANSLISKVAAAGWGTQRTRELLSSAVVILSAASFLGVALSIVLSALLPWPRWLKAPSLADHELRLATLLALLGVAIGVASSLGQKLELARQRGHAVAGWGALSSLSGPLAAAAVAVIQPNLVAVVGASAIAPPLVLGVQTVVALRSLPAELRPQPRQASRRDLREALSSGGSFMCLSLATFISFQVDTLIVSGVLGAAVAAKFSLVVRLFGLVSITMQNAMAQLWAAFAEALAKRDWHWIVSALRRWTLIAGVVTGSVSVFLVAFGQPIITTWVGEAFRPSLMLLVAAGVWYTYSAAAAPLSLFYNGAQLQRVQLLAVVPMSIANVLLSLSLTRSLGASGPLWASVMAHVVFVAIPLACYGRSWLRRQQQSPA